MNHYLESGGILGLGMFFLTHVGKRHYEGQATYRHPLGSFQHWAILQRMLTLHRTGRDVKGVVIIRLGGMMDLSKLVQSLRESQRMPNCHMF